MGKSEKKSKKEKKEKVVEEDVPVAEEKKEKKKKSKKDKKDKNTEVVEEVKEEKTEKKKSKKEKKDKVRKADSDDDETPKKKKSKSKEVEESEPAEEAAAPMETDSAPAASAANPDGICKCFLGNLSWDIDDDGAKEFFKDCGDIEEIFWLTDKESGKFKGAGFITFTTPEAAAKAVALAGSDLMGRPIKVEFSTPRPGGDRPKSPGAKGRSFEMSEKPEGCVTVFLGNLSWDIDDDQTKEFFKDCGEIKKIRWLTDRESGQFKGCGFVDFYETEAVDKAAKKNGVDLLGRGIRIDYAKARPPREF